MKKLNSICCIMLVFICSIYCINVCKVDKNIIYANTNMEFTSKAVLLLDYNSNTIIYEKNKDEKLPIASMVKLMTIYITFENIENGSIKYEDLVRTSENASGMGGSQVFIDAFVEYSVSDLLRSVIISSANDASVALAEFISGSESEFVDLMNKKAQELQMKNTLYSNCTGLPAPEQYSTANDCAILLKNLLKFEDYHKFSTVWMDELIHPSGRKTELVNTNKLIRYYNGCDGGKTGSTNEAGYCLTTTAKRNNMRLISVIIGAKTGNDRFKESSQLLNYGFANYENKLIVDSSIVLKEIKTNKCKEKNAEIIAMEDFYVFDKKGVKSDYSIEYILPEHISKTKNGEIVGKVIISKQGVIYKEIMLTVKNDLHALTYMDNIKGIINNW